LYSAGVVFDVALGAETNEPISLGRRARLVEHVETDVDVTPVSMGTVR